jgi:hypothetical protein
MFLRWIVTNITSARGTLHGRNTRIPCGDQLVIYGLYVGPHMYDSQCKQGLFR